MKNYITTFNAKKTNLKIAYSPYFDNTFIFNTYELKEFDNLRMFNILVSNWILNIPLTKLKKPIRTFRRIKDLEMYFPDYINYFILDIDKVQTKENRDKILEYFSIYKCIIGESKSYNNKNNFNMKGILFIEPLKLSDAKQAIQNINHDLKEYCEIDEAVARRVSLNAPIQKNKVLLNRDKILYKCKLENRIQKVQDGYVEVQKNKKIKIDIENISGDTIEELCLNTFKSIGFEAISAYDNGSIRFKHPSEIKTKGGYFWFSTSPYTMHHNNSTKSINIYDVIRKTEIGKTLLSEKIDYDDAFLHYNTATKLIKVYEKYLTVNGKEQYIQEFLDNKDGLFSINSPMGTAKSTIINYIIEQSHERDMRVMIITNRISVAQDFGKKYNIKVYNKDSYELNDSIIVQFDSLWKYDLRNFDIVIMDEFISLMCHSRNSLGNSALNIVKFFSAFNKKLVIADAFLTGYENFLLENKTSNVFQLMNTYRDKTILYNYSDKNYFFQVLLNHAKKGKITISGTTLKFLQSTKALLEKHGLKVILLTAETPQTTKELIYKLFEEEEHDKWDVFMYSPALTVGVSNLNKVNYHFHYDSSRSCDVISSIQMIKRTRKASEIHMFIQEHIRYIKTSYNEIRDDYMNNIGKNIEQNFMFSVDDYGETRLSEIGKKAIKIDTFKNILEFNHKKAMFWMMKYHFLNEPINIETKFEGNILLRYEKMIKEKKLKSEDSLINEYFLLSDLEKMDILMGVKKSSETIINRLCELDEYIKLDTNKEIKAEIFKIALNNKQFLKYCRHYKILRDYTDKFISDKDLKAIISRVLISKDADISFYNKLLKYGQNPIQVYYIGTPDKRLLSILKDAGYKKGPKENIPYKDLDLMAESEKYEYLEAVKKVWRVDPNVKKYYSYIKDI